MIEVTKETRKRLKTQAVLEGMTMKQYVEMLAKQQAGRAEA